MVVMSTSLDLLTLSWQRFLILEVALVHANFRVMLPLKSFSSFTIVLTRFQPIFYSVISILSMPLCEVTSKGIVFLIFIRVVSSVMVMVGEGEVLHG